MIYRIHTPSSPLSDFVEYFYYCEGYSPSHHKEKVLPDGAIDLFVDLSDEPKKLFANETDEIYIEYKKSWISGGRTKYIVIQSGNLKMAGIRFKPGGTFPFLSFPVSELNDQVIDLDLIWGNEVHGLRDKLLEAITIETLFNVFEKYMYKKAAGDLEQHPLLHYALAQLVKSPGDWDMKRLSAKLGISNKHLITLFARHVGLSPKLFCRISKFQKVLQLIETEQKIEWAPLAYECGYYDQAHFIKEFNSFSGINPSAYLTRKGEYINSIPL